MTKLAPELQKIRKQDLRKLLKNEFQMEFNVNDLAICPFHDDHTPSFSAFQGEDGDWRWKCFGCKKHGDYFDFRALRENRPLEEILKEYTGTRPPQPENCIPAIFIYKDSKGSPLFRKLKFSAGYSQELYVNGDWAPGLGGLVTPLYNLPELINCDAVLLLEGEKDCESVKRLGFVATTMGSITQWRPDFATHFAGKDVSICFDVGNEAVAMRAASDISQTARSVKILELPGLTQREEDITDWLERMVDLTENQKAEKLRELIATTPVYSKDSDPARPKKPHAALAFFDFLKSDLPPRDVFMENWAERENLTILGGYPKVGKSILAVNLGLCIACGQGFLGFRSRGQSRVLYIQQEICESAMQERLNRMRNRVDDFAANNFMIKNTAGTSLKLTRPDGLREVENIIGDSAADLVILDPFSTFHDRDENSAADMDLVMGKLSHLMHRFKVGILVLHHYGKPTLAGRQGNQRIRGSSLITDRADGIILIDLLDSEKEHDVTGQEGLARISFTLRNDQEPPPITIARDPDSLWYERVDVALLHKAGKVPPQKVLEVVRNEGGSIRQASLEKKLFPLAARGTIRKAVGEALSLGLIESEPLSERGAPLLLKIPDPTRVGIT